MNKSHMESYLQQQSQMVVYDKKNDADNVSMEEFKQVVKKWFEIDNYIKRVQEVIKEKRTEKNKLSDLIVKFMCKYDIEDLNTKEGRIRCKNVSVKAPVSKQVVKQRIADYFGQDQDKKTEILQKIYEEGEKVEKVTLRRLKIS